MVVNTYAEKYQALRAQTARRPKGPEDWDYRSAAMRAESSSGNHYNREFLKRVDLTGCETVLDVGCGTGNLLVPLAAWVRQGTGIDFSAGMIRAAKDRAAEARVRNVVWVEDDWLHGAELPSADVVTASRCMDVDDLRTAALRLDAVALKRVYMTYRVGRSYLSDALLDVVGRGEPERPDHMLVMNVLHEAGIRACLDFIVTQKKRSVYDSVEQFVKRVRWSVPDLSEVEQKRLQHFYERNMTVENGQRMHEHSVCWAFISWEKR